ncbi:MAG: holdfast anchor protein HfaD [Phenylobacterium sp.]|uniref:holdfast anchor protein HfaD n=1 Tax=Phenylobacterium sp. TaxID=1871053 RepID=UPI0027375469|nr:holdfast anchor protein HfaD [Phenylobacterium sp.]MDP3175180.1 holdfast anchor protein HfaD [Phenylobacterium sp.]
MRRPAKILLAGTLAAILPFAAASSLAAPSDVLNDQIQLGDVFSQQTLDVVEVSETTSGTTTATGNSFDGTVDQGDLAVTSTQSLQANVGATTELNVASSSGAVTALTTAATGNTGDAGVFAGGLTGSFVQTTGATNVSANSHIEAPGGQAGDVASSVQAIGNSQGFGVTSGASYVSVDQTNQAQVTSDGGGVYNYIGGQATFSAASAANNLTAASAGGSSQQITATQANDAAITQASQFTSFGNAYLTTTSATATGNNISAGNEGSTLALTTDQRNSAYVRAETVSNAYEFGAGSAVSYGVGNSAFAGNAGTETLIDNTQLNDGGGIDVAADYTGYQGYDAQASATAIGNAATGYACAECDGYVSVANRQTNNAEVGAQSSTSVTSARTVTGVANAIGNTASYYVSRPNQ